MNFREVQIAGVTLHALSSGALWWPGERLLAVSDMHLGKSGRIARGVGGPLLPPYETEATLSKLDADMRALGPERVVCLGDSFDDDAAARDLSDAARDWILRLQAGRDWIWVEGNHDPAGLAPGGAKRRDCRLGPLVFRHIAEPGASGEISGHYHPKAILPGPAGRVSRPCFLADGARMILPAYGQYTGGLSWLHPAFEGLLGSGARAILTGRVVAEVPHPGLAA